MITPAYLVGFTGHRHLADPSSVAASLRAALAEVRERVIARGGTLEFYGSVAYGADALAIEAAHDLGLPVHLILPKSVARNPHTGEVDPLRGFAADFWDGDPANGGTFRQADWDRTLRHIRHAEKGHGGGSLRIAPGSQEEPECYYEAGVRMLEAVDVLVAVWDGGEERGLGGTANLIGLARKQLLPCLLLPANGGEPERHDLEQLGADEESRARIGRVSEYSRNMAPEADTAERGFDALFSRLEACCERDSDHFRNSLEWMIYWHGAATIAAACAAILPQVHLGWKICLALLSITEAALVGRAVYRNRQLQRDHVHERWMEARFATELMRGLRDSGGLLDPLHPLIALHHPRWRRFAVTVGLLLQREHPPLPDWREACRAYVENRLRNPDIRFGQIKYFRDKQAEAEPIFRTTLKVGTWLGHAALFFVLGAVMYKCWVIFAKLLHHWYPPSLPEVNATWLSWTTAILFSLLPIVLPLLAGVFIALRSTRDSGRRTYRYQELADRLTAVARQLDTLETEATVRRTVAYTEEILLDELIEWHLAERQNGAH